MFNIKDNNYGYLPRENEDGCIEYKLKLLDISNDKIIKYATQMKWRLEEGNGLAIYFIGLLDNGKEIGILNDEIKETIKKLKLIVKNINVKLDKYFFYSLEYN